MAEEKAFRVPHTNETLMLADGRRFVFAEIQDGVRGWWFLARAEDGSSTLQGNLRLEWDSHSHAWRPVSARVPIPRSIKQTSQSRMKQVD
jgi:hypothetical protein